MSVLLKGLLLPFTFIYTLVTSFRNHLYNIGHKRSHQFSVLTIGVGNLKVGGVGKTPFSEYLIRELLLKKNQVSYLSRGYGRLTKGFLEVKKDSVADQVGDEALQVALKFSDANVFVCEDRVIAIPEILHRQPGTNVVVLDDVYQHRRINTHVNILLTAFHDLFSDDCVLPSGRLREAKKGAKRADLVVVTKTPKTVSEEEKNDVKTKLLPFLEPETGIVFSSSSYNSFEVVLGKDDMLDEVITVSALANNDVFVSKVSESKTVVNSFEFRDHHIFDKKEIDKIISFAHQNDVKQIITTEKDWQRLKLNKDLLLESGLSVAVLPIYFELDNENLLWQLIRDEEAKL